MKVKTYKVLKPCVLHRRVKPGQMFTNKELTEHQIHTGLIFGCIAEVNEIGETVPEPPPVKLSKPSKRNK